MHSGGLFMIHPVYIYTYMHTHTNTPPIRNHIYTKFTHTYVLTYITYVLTYIHVHKCIHTHEDKEINTENNLQRLFCNFTALFCDTTFTKVAH